MEPEPISDSPGPVTVLLKAAADGDRTASDKLMQLVYDELRTLAHAKMSHERRGHTLQTTALVNEAYVRLLGKEGVNWTGQGHFFRAAAGAMRRILVDHARGKNADKRGGGKAALSISSIGDVAATDDSSGFLALENAITRLEGVDPQAAEVVRLKFYAGLADEAVADALAVSPRTVRRDWAFARAWLRDSLEREAP